MGLAEIDQFLEGGKRPPLVPRPGETLPPSAQFAPTPPATPSEEEPVGVAGIDRFLATPVRRRQPAGVTPKEAVGQLGVFLGRVMPTGEAEADLARMQRGERPTSVSLEGLQTMYLAELGGRVDLAGIQALQRGTQAGLPGPLQAARRGVEAIRRPAPPSTGSLQAIDDYLQTVPQATGAATTKSIAQSVRPTPEPAQSTSLAEVPGALRRTFAPATVSPEPAKTAAGVVRAKSGAMARQREMDLARLEPARRELARLPWPEQETFIAEMEAGTPQSQPRLQGAADTMRALLDERRSQVQAVKPGALEHFIQDYFPHIWKDPAQVRTVMAELQAKRPLAGPGSFLRHRTIPTLRDGLALGFEPVDPNPATLVALKLQEMDKFIFGQRVFQELKDVDLAKFVRFGAQPPSGWVPIHDKIAQVIPFDPTAKGFVLRGRYYTPRDAGRILDNYLSPGLHGHPLYDAWRGFGNLLNMAQLGLSGFHAFFTAMDAAISRASLGVTEALTALQSGRPLAAAAGGLKAIRGALPEAQMATLLKGSRVLREYLRPGTQGAEIAATVDQLVEAGGRVRMDTFYRASAAASFQEALQKGSTLGAPLRGFSYVLQKASSPVMEYLVPRMKLGVFADLAEHELARLPNASPLDKRLILQRAWDSVDNRLGQMVYDNLFWNKMLKDGLLASVRSLGWNVGTFRELGTGGIQLIKAVVKAPVAAIRREPIEITPPMAYTIALPFVTALYGGMLHYLLSGQAPAGLKDYFFPWTGRVKEDRAGGGVRKERLSLPSYVRDVYAYGTQPWTTIKHKVNPSVMTVVEMLENEDFYRAAIRNPDDPAVQQMTDVATYLLRSFEPFSFRGLHPSSPAGPAPAYPYSSFVGVTPAPAYVERSAEQRAEAFRRSHRQQLRRKQRREQP